MAQTTTTEKTSRTITTTTDLIAHGLIDDGDRKTIDDVCKKYALAIPPAMANLIDDCDEHDPIAAQFVPDKRELVVRPEERSDPIGDFEKSPLPGLVHRYPDRVLLKLIDTCPVYCRFCFRREMVGPKQQGQLTDQQIDSALQYISTNPRIWEVIMTGGDPLALSSRRIRKISQKIQALSNIKVVRWHSRVPIVAPEMIAADKVEAMKICGKSIVVAVHANHARELTLDARAAVGRLTAQGVMVVSQTVLLRGINDNADVLETLMRTFVEIGVKPYYLHHMDLAPGTAHFRVPLMRGQEIMQELRGRLSGIAQPTYVLDIPGAHGKVPVTANYVSPDKEQPNRYIITDPEGIEHVYQDNC